MARSGLKSAAGQALRPAQDAHLNREVQDLAPHGEVDPSTYTYGRVRRIRIGRHRVFLGKHHVYLYRGELP
jgi:hypothetical protein